MVCKCECEIQRNIVFEHIKEQSEHSQCEKLDGGGIQFGRKYTPLYENDKKKTQIMSMETTQQKIEGQKLLMGGEQGGGVKAILCQVVTVVLPVNILQRVFSGLVTLTHVI